jgi:hypothetical protein
MNQPPRAYYPAMRALSAEIRDDILADTALLWSERRTLTPAHLLTLALWYDVTPAAIAWILEDLGVLGAGVYDELKRRGFQPMKELARMKKEQ